MEMRGKEAEKYTTFILGPNILYQNVLKSNIREKYFVWSRSKHRTDTKLNEVTDKNAHNT